MKLNRKFALLITSIVIASLFMGTAAMAVRDDRRGGPFQELWEAIFKIQEDLETRIPKKGYVSVPAAAFNPLWSNYDTINQGETIWHKETTEVTFFASVQLPDGTTITNLTIYWNDKGSERIVCRLWESRQTQASVIAHAESPWTSGPGYGSSYGDPNYLCTVNNSQYTYFLEVIIPPNTLVGVIEYHFQHAIIEYEYQAR